MLVNYDFPLNTGNMIYLIVKQQVEDFDTWHRVFSSHRIAQQKAGLYDLQLFRDLADPNLVTCIFRVEDLKKAKLFTTNSGARNAQSESNMIGSPEIQFLEKIN